MTLIRFFFFLSFTNSQSPAYQIISPKPKDSSFININEQNITFKKLET